MIVRYKTLDIKMLVEREGTHYIVLHGCNAANGFGSGFAGAVASRWPEVKAEYHRVTSKYPPNKLMGRILPEYVSDGITICNGYTQLKYGRDGKRYADPQAIVKCLTKCIEYSKTLDNPTILMPRIGCDLGGLDWSSEVKPLIYKLCKEHKDTQTKLYIIQP